MQKQLKDQKSGVKMMKPSKYGESRGGVEDDMVVQEYTNRTGNTPSSSVERQMVIDEYNESKKKKQESKYACGGSVKKHSKGGSVRGAGKAQKGVRACKMR